VQIPGLGGGLVLRRTWNSKWPLSQAVYNTGIFGVHWRSTFEEQLFVGSDGTMKYSRADGSFWSFAFSAFINQSGVIVGSTFNVAAPSDQTATLTVIDPNWAITFKNGEKRVFQASSGKLISIVDRNGNTTQLAYNNANQLVTVTDPAGRHLSFTYSTGAVPVVVGVSVDVGVSLTYSYDGVGRLVTVTKPDQTFISIEYDSNSRITAVKDSAGKILEAHTYDTLGRGLTSTRANGVDAITISYPQ
jgi:YD repeat-containing protein